VHPSLTVPRYTLGHLDDICLEKDEASGRIRQYIIESRERTILISCLPDGSETTRGRILLKMVDMALDGKYVHQPIILFLRMV
jgi:hypothetical protein